MPIMGIPFGCDTVVLNHWPYNQICIGCPFDRLIEYKEKENDDERFFGRGSICLRQEAADICVRHSMLNTTDADFKAHCATLDKCKKSLAETIAETELQHERMITWTR